MRGNRMWSRTWMYLVVIALLAASCSGHDSQPRAVPILDPDLEAKVGVSLLELVNREREAAGLPGLQWDHRTEAIARAYAIEMRRTQAIPGVPSQDLLENDVALQHIAFARSTREILRGLMSCCGNGGILMSDTATDAAIGIALGEEVYGTREIFITALVRKQPKVDPAGASVPPPPSPPPPPPVPSSLLEGWRISGSSAIVPDDETKRDIARAHKRKLRGSYKLCLDPDGTPVSISPFQLTGFPAYDLKIMREMESWRYRPYMVNGKPVPVCTAVTFIYSQQ